jgi:glycosyltransferase involved in cell wall biosynthesis
VKITLAFLAYNEADAIERVVRDAIVEMEKSFTSGDWEILVINDGSKDATGEICDRLSEEPSDVRVYHHNPNRGYVEATLSALRESRGDYICIFDGDGQHTAADVARINFIGPELYTRARLNDLKIAEMPVTHFPREGGETSHKWGKIPTEVLQVLNYLRALRGELQAAGKWRRFIP